MAVVADCFFWRSFQQKDTDEVFEINAGEFLQLQADNAHTYECLGDEMATAIMQVGYLP